VQPIYTRQRIIGLLGGSFNPAHEGHLHISELALKRLKCDQVWWLVSPQNPLKDEQTLADYIERLESAYALAASNRRIVVSDLEAREHLYYTFETIEYLKRHYPAARFVWLMGADNLAQFHRWQHYQWIIKNVPIVVFDRVPFSHTSLRSEAALKLRKYLIKNNSLKSLKRVPAFLFLHLKRNANSSTYLRKKLGKRAFLRHNNSSRKHSASS
jgi:nicotinate-nucleotide adenylyltransferase